MPADFIPALAIQLPFVAIILFAVYKDLLRSGPRVDKERAFLVDLWREEQSARQVLEDKLDVLAHTLKEATDVMERSVELNERIINDVIRPAETRTRSGDRRSS